MQVIIQRKKKNSADHKFLPPAPLVLIQESARGANAVGIKSATALLPKDKP